MLGSTGVILPQSSAVPTSIMPTAIIPNVAAINQQIPISQVGVAAPAQIPLIPPNAATSVIPSNATNGSLLIDTIASVPESQQSLPAPPTPPSATQSRTMSFSETKAPSIGSPESVVSTSQAAEWAIKKDAKLKYTQLFNATDHTRSGFLTGAQARGLLMQSKLPQAALAQIWQMSDMDSDGRLGCEEFVLAMYLCELGTQGKPIPTKLPPELIPPSFRKSTSRHGSVAGIGSIGPSSRHGSISSQTGSVKGDTEITLANFNQTSFEDKRKENYDKGQAELDRRRRVLEEAARKEQEERERKEREEIEKKEK